MTPEQKAREKIDKQLVAAGWVIQDYRDMNPGAAKAIAIREYPTDSGPADYLLMVDRVHLGVIEAKPAGTVLSPVEVQAERYATSQIKWRVSNEPLPLVYQSTGEETRFTDLRDPKPRARNVFTFHQPGILAAWHVDAKTLRARLLELPALSHEGLRTCQIVAIENLETSLKEARPRALVQMATGAGKTYTAITAVYRYLKIAKGRRVLFLVDTRNLGKQAEQEFQAYTPRDDSRKFTELYNVQRLRSSAIDPSAQVCISTIQRMYSILRGEELDESAEEHSVGEAAIKQLKDVVYNPSYPPEFFDLIIIDQCHRSIYNVWKQVLDYFDAFMVGLTATPDARTYAFFDQNVVSEYTHEEAVVDGVNVGYAVYRIKTAVGEQGGAIEAGEWVDKRSRLTRRKRWEQIDEEVIYPPAELDRSVVNPNQIRTVIREFKRVLPSLFPDRFTKPVDGWEPVFEVPKTLIFAKTDSHADDIITIVREEFAEGNAFCRKITYNADDPEQAVADFRNDFNPRIAVTVDMIATGTDVKPLECLLFMRDVRSQNYFEQMKGRGKYREPAVPDTTGLPALPEGWEWATVEQLSSLVQYGSSAKTNDDSKGVRVLRMGNIQDGRIVYESLKYLPLKHAEFPALFLEDGDMLFNRTNSAELVGKTAVFKDTSTPTSFASYLIRVRFTEKELSDFVCHFINSAFGKSWIKAVVSQQVGQANVNGSKLQALVIPLPPLAEQERINAEVERQLSVVDNLEQLLSSN